LQGDWTADSGYQLASRLLKDYWGKFTSLMATSDLMALGAMRAFYENGVSVLMRFRWLALAICPNPPFSNRH
jgi:DNA-binding LacI/PurR family transcriptional regulator